MAMTGMSSIFSTSRLNIHEIDNQLNLSEHASFLQATCELLSPAVVQELPDDFQNINSAILALKFLSQLQLESRIFALYLGENLMGFIFAYEADAETAHIGYLLAEDYWGKGYAREALTGFIQFSKTLTWNILIAGVAATNLSSIKLLEKLDFQPIEKAPSGEQMFKLYLSR